MENLNQRVEPLVLLRKGTINTGSFWKEVETAKNHFFSGKYPADEVITIGRNHRHL
jgi:hypothetical protein